MKAPEDPYAFVWHGSAMRPDGTSFTDHAVHRMLKRMGVARGEGEWFRCTVAQVEAAVKELDNRLSIHDFRMVDGEHQINLIFDVVVPHSYSEKEKKQLQLDILEKASSLDPRYQCVVTLENGYVAEE